MTLPLRFLRQFAGSIRSQSVWLANRLGVGGLFGHPVSSEETKSKEESLPLPVESAEPTETEPPRAASTEQETELQVLQRSGLFDELFYCQANPDVATAGISPLEHYLSVGAFEGRRPNRLFDSAYYLRTYSDVAKAGVNPALHYFLDGAWDGRDPSVEFDTSSYLESNPDVAASGMNPLVHFLLFGANEGRLPLSPRHYKLVRRRAAERRHQEKFDYRPLLSVLMPIRNTRPIYLEAAVRSVMAQAYPNWELQIVDDGSSNPATLEALERIAARDERIFVTRNAQRRGISAVKNDALRYAHGEFTALLNPDDELTIDALYEVVRALNVDRTTDVVYSDQDNVSPEGEPAGHLFKPDWSPTLFRGVMFVGHLLTVRRSLALDAGGFNSAFDPVHDFEFMLRISERTRKIRHVPKVLYHWRRIPESLNGGGKTVGNIEQLQAAAVQAQLNRLQLDGFASLHPRHPDRVVIEAGPDPRKVNLDLIVHGQADSKAAAATVESVLARMGHLVARTLVPAAWSEVGMAGTATAGLSYYKTDRGVSEADRLSRFCRESSCEFVLAISADVAIDNDDWMDLLLLAAQESDVAVVCPAVLSTDGTIAYAGLVVGGDAVARPAMRGFEPESDGYAGSLSCAREISAAWADLVLLRRSPLASFLTPNPVYVTADFLVADLTLRATRSGLRAVCLPYLRARQQATAEPDSARRLDALLFQDLWVGKVVVDPFYNPNFVEIRADYT